MRLTLKLKSAVPKWPTHNKPMNCNRASLTSVEHFETTLTLPGVKSTNKNGRKKINLL